MATRGKSGSGDKASEIKANASKVWLAGLGALATAEEEGGKLFRGLVKKGESYERKGKAQFDRLRERVEELSGAARERVDAFADSAKATAGEAWERVSEKTEAVEERWDDQIHGVLRRVGVPSRNEIAALTDRVAHLTELVEKKLKPAPRKSAAARSTKSKKSTATRRKK
jgi:poly(hydroxyalkanoate) granule-associated protein